MESFENKGAVQLVISTVEKHNGTSKSNPATSRVEKAETIPPRDEAPNMVLTVHAGRFMVEAMPAKSDENRLRMARGMRKNQ